MNVGNLQAQGPGHAGVRPDVGPIVGTPTQHAPAPFVVQHRAGWVDASLGRAAFVYSRHMEQLCGDRGELHRPHSADESVSYARGALSSAGQEHAWWRHTIDAPEPIVTRTSRATFTVRVAAPTASALEPSSPWPSGLFAAIRHYALSRASSFDWHSEARLKYARDKVIGAAYLLMNALHSGDALDKPFKELMRQVHRMEKYVAHCPGTPYSSAQVLGEIAARCATVRDTTQYKILSFDRESLLRACDDAHALVESDRILLVIESGIVGSIAVYGPGLRALCGADAQELAAVNTTVDATLTREKERGYATPDLREDWLGVAVRRLPQSMLQRLHARLLGQNGDMSMLEDKQNECRSTVAAAVSTPSPQAALLVDIGRAVARRYAALEPY